MIWNIIRIILYAFVVITTLKAFKKERKTYNLVFGVFFAIQIVSTIILCTNINSNIVKLIDEASLVILLSGVFLYCKSALKANPK